MKKELSWSVLLVGFFAVMIGGIALASSVVFMQTKAKLNPVQANNLPKTNAAENKGSESNANTEQSQETLSPTQANPTAPQEESATNQDNQQVKPSVLTNPQSAANYGNGSSTTFDNIEAANTSPSKRSEKVKISARIDDTNPEDGYTTRLIVSGPKGGIVTAVCPVKAKPKTYYARLSYITGKAIIPIKTNDAYKGEKVILNITVNYEDRDYKTTAVFTAR